VTRQGGEAPASAVDEDQCAGDAGAEAQHRPGGRPRQRHRDGQHDGRTQAQADQGGVFEARQSRQQRAQPRLEGAQHRAGQVAEVVGAGEPARRMEVDRAFGQHHRQERREGKAADAHRDRERDPAGQRDRPSRRVGRFGTSGRCGRRGRIDQGPIGAQTRSPRGAITRSRVQGSASIESRRDETASATVEGSEITAKWTRVGGRFEFTVRRALTPRRRPRRPAAFRVSLRGTTLERQR